MINKKIINEDFKSSKLRTVIDSIKQLRSKQVSDKCYNYVEEILQELTWKMKPDNDDFSQEMKKYIIHIDDMLYYKHFDKFVDFIHNIKSTEQLDDFIVSGKMLNDFGVEYIAQQGLYLSDSDKKQLQDYITKIYNDLIKNDYYYKCLKEFMSDYYFKNNFSSDVIYAQMQRLFSTYGLDQITDDDVQVITDLSSFKRKARSECGMCIALNQNIPEYICEFSDNGAIDNIIDLSGVYRGRSRSSQVVRWNEVENNCDSIMIFKNLGDYTEMMKNRHPYKSPDSYYSSQYKSGQHLSDSKRAEIMKSDLNRELMVKKEKRQAQVDAQRRTNEYVDIVANIDQLLNNLKFKATSLFNDIKDYDPFDDDVDDKLAEKQQAISNGVLLYKKVKKYRNENVVNGIPSDNWKNKDIVDYLKKYTVDISNQIELITKYLN